MIFLTGLRLIWQAYGVTGLLQSTNPAPPDHGFQYFVASTGNAQVGTSTLTQNIDVSAGASAINGGNVKFTASAYLGNANDTPTGSAQVAFAFKNANGQTFSTATLGPESPGGTAAALELEQQIGLVPPGTMSVTVTITLTEFDGRGYGAADSVSLTLSTLGTIPASVLGANLLINPGGDQGPGVPSPATALYIPGWSRDESAQNAPASVAPYGGTGWIGPPDPVPSDRGVNVFWGTFGATLYQDLDVSAAGTLIDTGKLTYQVSVWLGGNAPSATLTYLFFDWSGTQLAATAQLGPVKFSGPGLSLTSHSDFLPAGTRRVHITLAFPSIGGSSVSWADDISFSIGAQGAPLIAPAGIVPVYSTATTIQPGEFVSIYGTNLGPASPAIWTGNFPTLLGGASVTIDGKPAYLLLVDSTQINLQAPDDTATGTVSVVVTTPNGTATSTVTLGEFGPSLSVLDGKHVAGIILRSDGSGAYGGGTYDIVGPTGMSLGYKTVAAKAGDTLELFGVGFGPTNPVVPAGQVYSGAAATTNSVQLLINSVPVLPAFSGLTSAGLYQLNVVQLPAGLGVGDVPLLATVGGVQTPTGVVISLQ
jgi:uncharacterized protein (TIGR03437 family)